MSERKEIADRFARDTVDHQMRVLHDDGLYRHLRFRNPARGAYWFDLVTWPGSLTIRGDLGNAYVFSRELDMFGFFRSDSGRINPHYWAQKTERGPGGCKSYSQEHAKALILDDVRERDEERPPGLMLALQREIFDTSHYEDETREALERFNYEGFRFYDTWEWDLHDYDWSFLWACHAIVWGIAQYDAAKAAEQPVSVPAGGEA